MNEELKKQIEVREREEKRMQEKRLGAMHDRTYDDIEGTPVSSTPFSDIEEKQLESMKELNAKFEAFIDRITPPSRIRIMEVQVETKDRFWVGVFTGIGICVAALVIVGSIIS